MQGDNLIHMIGLYSFIIPFIASNGVLINSLTFHSTHFLVVHFRIFVATTLFNCCSECCPVIKCTQLISRNAATSSNTICSVFTRKYMYNNMHMVHGLFTFLQK